MTEECQEATIDYTVMESGDLLHALADDGRAWAKAFHQYAEKLEGVNLDEEWLTTWFCNAIEHSGDVRRWRGQPQTLPVLEVPMEGRHGLGH